MVYPGTTALDAVAVIAILILKFKGMVSVCLCFKVHQPFHLKNYQAKDIDACHCYEDETADQEIIDSLADNCYLPANAIIYDQVIRQNGKFRISFSLSGLVLELLQKYRPDVVRSFKKLASTGCVEFLAETYYHSLSSLYSAAEFRRQVLKHSALIKTLFGSEPVIFRNTELIHNNRIASLVGDMGLAGIFCEGTEKILQGRSCNQLYRSAGNENLPVLLRNAVLSDDIAFRFGDPNWPEHLLTAAKFAGWLHQHPVNTELINLFLDYETFGVHKKKDLGIFSFLESLPSAVLKHEDFIFSTPGEVAGSLVPKDVYDVPTTISWEDKSNAGWTWCENVMQNNTLKKIFSLDKLVLQSPDEQDRETWGRLQSADYFYYMADNNQRPLPGKYPNPYSSAREVFQHYTNQVADFEISVIKKIIAYQKKMFPAKNIPFNILTN